MGRAGIFAAPGANRGLNPLTVITFYWVLWGSRGFRKVEGIAEKW